MITNNTFHIRRPSSLSYDEWLSLDDFVAYLENSVAGRIPIYAHWSNPSSIVTITSLLIPAKILRKPNTISELKSWNFVPGNYGWGEVVSYKNGKQIHSLEGPFQSDHELSFRNATALIFNRQNRCYKDLSSYYEVNQEITQTHDLHWLSELSAYGTLGEDGEIQEVIKISRDDERTYIDIDEQVLMKHLILGKYVLVRFFDADRWKGENVPTPDPDTHTVNQLSSNNIHAEWRFDTPNIETSVRSFIHGVQIIKPPISSKRRRFYLDREIDRKYCTFIVYDWKNKRTAESSCDPARVGNYFVPSPYPFGTSPAFFKREMLVKYKNNPDKYTVEDRSVTCMSAWSFKYDVNEAGQIHIFLKDLSHLPYSEQLYLKSTNVEPEAGISKRSFKTDFLAKWDEEPEPLRDLKKLLKTFPQASHSANKTAIWKLPLESDSGLLDELQYTSSDSRKEWEVDISAFDRVIVEGFNTKALRRIIKHGSIETDGEQSISLLKLILESKNVDPIYIEPIIGPLKELHHIRSKLSSHRKGGEADVILSNIRKIHRSFQNHSESIVAELYESMRLISDLIENQYFDIPKNNE